MKKINWKNILIVLGIVFISCGFTISNREGDSIHSRGEDMRTIQYHGHTYICYRFFDKQRGLNSSGYGYGGAGLIHDPDCKCQKKK